MRIPRVYPILDTAALDRCGISLEVAAGAFIEGGAGILQIRHKAHWSRAVYVQARVVARMCREAGVELIVNDRADFAMLFEAGLHVGQDDLAPRYARALLGGAATIGYSSHNAAQLTAAGGEPVDYVALGPMFATGSKENPDPVVGVEELRSVRGLIEKPLVAIGGITLANAREVWAAGADSVAVIGGMIPEAPAALGLRRRMEEWQALQALTNL